MTQKSYQSLIYITWIRDSSQMMSILGNEEGEGSEKLIENGVCWRGHWYDGLKFKENKNIYWEPNVETDYKK